MVAPAAGAVVLVRFPFSDLSRTKLRPAVALADAGRGDWILCQVTSRRYGDRCAVRMSRDRIARGAMRIDSFARPGKLFTASSSVMVGEVASLNRDLLGEIVEATVSLLRTALR